MRVPPWVVCVFPGVFLSSRVTGACPVTTDLIMRVNVRTTTTIVDFSVWGPCTVMTQKYKRVVVVAHEHAAHGSAGYARACLPATHALALELVER